jgi:6-phosphogluconolactonase
MSTNLRFIDVPTREQASDIAVQILTAELDLALAKRGRASLLLSGGSSPRPVYEQLSKEDLDWGNIVCGLVDERWVAKGHSASNASFIDQTLLQNKASAAVFLPMTNAAPTAIEGAHNIDEHYRAMGQPFDICVMGMGTDGHTASWFPDSPDLNAALDKNGQDLVMAVDASLCAGAGEVRERITLTLPSVLSSGLIILLIMGAEKHAVFKRARALHSDGDVTTHPVAALLDAGEKLVVIWAP